MMLITAVLLVCLSALPVAAQIPPTPTPQPPGVARFNLPDSYSLWGSTDLAIQTWNWLGDGRALVQLLAIIAIVVLGMFIVWKFFSQMTRRDSEN
jgi:hypothetical protein